MAQPLANRLMFALGGVGALAGLAFFGVWESSPAIGKGLPGNIADAQRVFDDRIRARFPVGSPESDLKSVLAAQEFKLDPGAGVATRIGGLNFPCDTRWIVVWKGDAQHRLAQVSGRYGLICP